MSKFKKNEKKSINSAIKQKSREEVGQVLVTNQNSILGVYN